MIKENKFLLHRLSDSIKIVSILLICLLFTQDCFDFKSSKQNIVDKKNTKPGDVTYFVEYDIKEKYSLDDDIIIEFKIGRDYFYPKYNKVYYLDELNIYASKFDNKKDNVLVYKDSNYSSSETLHYFEKVYDGAGNYEIIYHYDYCVDLTIPKSLLDAENGTIWVTFEILLEFDMLKNANQYPESDIVERKKVYYDGGLNVTYSKVNEYIYLK